MCIVCNGRCAYLEGLLTGPKSLFVSMLILEFCGLLLLILVHYTVLKIITQRHTQSGTLAQIPASIAMPRWEIVLITAGLGGAAQSCIISLQMLPVGSAFWCIALIVFAFGPLAFLVWVARMAHRLPLLISFHRSEVSDNFSAWLWAKCAPASHPIKGTRMSSDAFQKVVLLSSFLDSRCSMETWCMDRGA